MKLQQQQQQAKARTNLAVYMLFGGCLMFLLLTFVYVDRRENLRAEPLLEESRAVEMDLFKIKDIESQSEVTPATAHAQREASSQLESLMSVFKTRAAEIESLRPLLDTLRNAQVAKPCRCTNQLLFRENEIGQFKKQRSIILAEIAKKQMHTQCPYLSKMTPEAIPESALVPYPSKAERLIEYGKTYQIKTMVETGTYQGSTSFQCANHFKKLYTIELSHELYLQNLPGFLNRPNTVSLEGDSGVVLKNKVLPELFEPTIFWLDGHYSSTGTARGDVDSPIFYELTNILQHPLASKFIIIIDDMRLFKGYDSECKSSHSDQIQCYPSILEIGELFCAFQKNHRMAIRVDEDAIIAIGGDFLEEEKSKNTGKSK
jgi:hypothetical protein